MICSDNIFLLSAAFHPTGPIRFLPFNRRVCIAMLQAIMPARGEFTKDLPWFTYQKKSRHLVNILHIVNLLLNPSVCCSLVPGREKSTAVAAAKPASVASSKGEYVITKLDDLVNWARRVSQWEGISWMLCFSWSSVVLLSLYFSVICPTNKGHSLWFFAPNKASFV